MIDYFEWLGPLKVREKVDAVTTIVFFCCPVCVTISSTMKWYSFKSAAYASSSRTKGLAAATSSASITGYEATKFSINSLMKNIVLFSETIVFISTWPLPLAFKKILNKPLTTSCNVCKTLSGTSRVCPRGLWLIMGIWQQEEMVGVEDKRSSASHRQQAVKSSGCGLWWGRGQQGDAGFHFCKLVSEGPGKGLGLGALLLGSNNLVVCNGHICAVMDAASARRLTRWSASHAWTTKGSLESRAK